MSSPEPTERSSPLRLGLLGVVLLAAIALMVWYQINSPTKLTELPRRDFVEYWAAGQLLAKGDNPYDLDKLVVVEQEAGWKEPKALPMLNPPWTLPFVLPLGWLTWQQGHWLWLGFLFVTLLVCAEWGWRVFEGDRSFRLLGQVLTWIFIPSLSAVAYGQISPLMLLGAVAFLAFVRDRRDLLAGAACCLLAVKPHLAYLFWPAIVLWAIQQRRWRILLGGILTGLLLVGIAMAFRPTICVDYWRMMSSADPAKENISPTWGTLIRLVFDLKSTSWQFVSIVPGLLWFAWWWFRQKGEPREWFGLVLLVSMLTAPYGAWLFDLVLLLVPIYEAGAGLTVAGSDGKRVTSKTKAISVILFYLAINAVTLVILVRESWHLEFMWITPVLLLGYVVLDGGRRRSI